MDFKSVMRGLGLWLSKTLFVMFLIGFIGAFAVSNLTSEEFLKPIIGEVLAAQMSSMPVSEQYQSLLDQCDREKTEIIDIPFESDMSNFSLKVNCTSLIKNGESEVTNIFKNQVTDGMFSEFYDREVCDGYECLDVLKNLQNPMDLVTRDFNTFFKDNINLLAMIAGVFAVFVVLLAKGWAMKFTALGGSMVTAGLPFFMIKLLQSNIGSILPAEASSAVPFLVSLLAPVANMFMIVLIIGAVLSASGFGIKMYQKKKENKPVKGKKK